jgi:hypothetical protein
MRYLLTVILFSLMPYLYGQYIPDRNLKNDYQNVNLTSGFKYIKTGRHIKYVSAACLATGSVMVIDSRYTFDRSIRNTGIVLLAAGASTYLIGESFEVEGFNRLHLGFMQLRIDIGKLD